VGTVKRIEHLLARARGTDPLKRDAVLAALLATWALIESSIELQHQPHAALAVLMFTAAAATVAWRRRWPIQATAAALALFGIGEQLASTNEVSAPAFAALLSFYSVGAHLPTRRGNIAELMLLAQLGLVVAIVSTTHGAIQVISSVALFGVMPFAVGRALAGRRALTDELQARARRLEAEREERAREAVTDERTRIARELHDIVAHCVSVMVIQTGAARRVAGSDRGAAREALGAVESSGREALAEMRRMVGVLRKGDAELAGATQPDLSQLAALAARARAAGLPVELYVEGQPRELPAGVELAAYRVVQEALTNSIKHAGEARARVVVLYGSTMLELEISDDGRGPVAAEQEHGSGHGLVGMSERLRLYGGELRSGRRRGGGFAVRARIPLESERVA
jgi:signal transduction histidine kinase